MKIRTGFVSNSSSSSFVYVFKKDNPHLFLKNLDINWEKIDKEFSFKRSYYDDSIDVKIDNEEDDITEYGFISKETSMDEVMDVLLKKEVEKDNTICKEEIIKAREECISVLENIDECPCIFEESEPKLYELFSRYIMIEMVEKGYAALVADISVGSDGGNSIYLTKMPDILKRFRIHKVNGNENDCEIDMHEY